MGWTVEGELEIPAPCSDPPSGSRVLDERNGAEVGTTSRQVLVEDTQKVQGVLFTRRNRGSTLALFPSSPILRKKKISSREWTSFEFLLRFALNLWFLFPPLPPRYRYNSTTTRIIGESREKDLEKKSRVFWWTSDEPEGAAGGRRGWSGVRVNVERIGDRDGIRKWIWGSE